MPRLLFVTRIQAPVEVCFDLARSIDLHLQTMDHTQERAIGGVTSGLIGLGETVTWEAVHFGLRQRLTSKITEFNYPYSFTDEMQEGPFKSLRHQHQFESLKDLTIMTDEFIYRSPYGFLGTIADALFLKNYMKKLLEKRNEIIKQQAELYAKNPNT